MNQSALLSPYHQELSEFRLAYSKARSILSIVPFFFLQSFIKLIKLSQTALVDETQ